MQTHQYFSAGLLLPHDPYPDHLKKLEEQISSGDASRKVLKEVLADEAKVGRKDFSCKTQNSEGHSLVGAVVCGIVVVCEMWSQPNQLFHLSGCHACGYSWGSMQVPPPSFLLVAHLHVTAR